jgi:hypothetical protein
MLKSIANMDVGRVRQVATDLQRYIVGMMQMERVVYCRHGREYIG